MYKQLEIEPFQSRDTAVCSSCCILSLNSARKQLLFCFSCFASSSHLGPPFLSILSCTAQLLLVHMTFHGMNEIINWPALILMCVSCTRTMGKVQSIMFLHKMNSPEKVFQYGDKLILMFTLLCIYLLWR